MTRPIRRRLDGVDESEMTVLDAVVAGTKAAGKAVVADANVNTGVSKITALHIGASGSETEVTSTAAELNILDGVTATAGELNNAADVSARVQELLASGAVTAGIQSIELNHISTIIAATVADATAMQGFVMVKNTSASGTAAHTVTLTGGTWNGTATIVTLDAPNEAILVYIDSAGDGTIIENVGTVVLS